MNKMFDMFSYNKAITKSLLQIQVNNKQHSKISTGELQLTSTNEWKIWQAQTELRNYLWRNWLDENEKMHRIIERVLWQINEAFPPMQLSEWNPKQQVLLSDWKLYLVHCFPQDG